MILVATAIAASAGFLVVIDQQKRQEHLKRATTRAAKGRTISPALKKQIIDTGGTAGMVMGIGGALGIYLSTLGPRMMLMPFTGGASLAMPVLGTVLPVAGSSVSGVTATAAVAYYEGREPSAAEIGAAAVKSPLLGIKRLMGLGALG